MNCEPARERNMPYRDEPPPYLIIKPFAAAYKRLLNGAKATYRRRGTCSGGNCQLCYILGLKCANDRRKAKVVAK